eukprot:99511-Amphidinium_carterae.1
MLITFLKTVKCYLCLFWRTWSDVTRCLSRVHQRSTVRNIVDILKKRGRSSSVANVRAQALSKIEVSAPSYVSTFAGNYARYYYTI